MAAQNAGQQDSDASAALLEPWEAIWRRWEKGEGEGYDFTQWQHELFRPNLRPYDPKEIRVMKKYFDKADAKFEACKK